MKQWNNERRKKQEERNTERKKERKKGKEKEKDEKRIANLKKTTDRRMFWPRLLKLVHLAGSENSNGRRYCVNYWIRWRQKGESEVFISLIRSQELFLFDFKWRSIHLGKKKEKEKEKKGKKSDALTIQFCATPVDVVRARKAVDGVCVGLVEMQKHVRFHQPQVFVLCRWAVHTEEDVHGGLGWWGRLNEAGVRRGEKC